jgi:hypothetical protein
LFFAKPPPPSSGRSASWQSKRTCAPVITNIDEKALERNELGLFWLATSGQVSPTSAGVRPLSETLIDRIYECAFAPEHWPGVFDELAKIAGARGGFLFTANRQVINWTASASLQAGMQAFVAGDFYTRGSRARRAIASGHTGFLREYDIYTDDQLAVDPIYRDLLWPAGLGWAAAMAIRLPTGDELFLSVERERSRGPVEAAAVEHLDALRPHLARTALMSARLQLERARAATATLASIGLPALVFDLAGRVLVANELGGTTERPRPLASTRSICPQRLESRRPVAWGDGDASVGWRRVEQIVSRAGS